MFTNNTVKSLHLVRAVYTVALMAVFFLMLQVTAQAAQVTLTWDASTSSGVTGYHIVYGKTSSNYTAQVDAGTSTQYTVANLEDGKIYYFAVHAHNSGDTASSANSNEVNKALPAVAPMASFSVGGTSGPAPFTVAFTNSSTGTAPLTYAWTFGDGSTSTAQNPSKTYSSAGIYTVALTVTGPGGSNTKTMSNYITVTNPTATAPVASFTATPVSGAAPLLVTLACNSTGTITSRTWDLGDGTTSTAQSVAKTYNAAGTYTVKLTVSSAAGSSTTSKTITATAIAPIANFTASPTSGTAPLATTFTNTSTGAIVSYTWNFGDNTATSTAQSPAHTFASVGTYTVTLTATGSTGTTPSTKTQLITVTAATAGNGLVAAYNFEEASGATVVDASGKGNHGVITEATRTASGKFGKTLTFDGVNDWVTVNDSASLDLTTGMTLEAWVYPTATSTNWTAVIAKEYPQSTPGSSYYLHASAENNQPLSEIYTDSQLLDLYGGSPLTLNKWTHLVATYDGTTQRLYMNGAEVANMPSSGNLMVSNGVLRIGGHGIWGEFFKGRIDEVRIYNRALSATEIKTDMNTAVATSSPPTRLLGDQAIGSVADSLPQGMAAAFQTTASVTGRVTSLPVYVDTGSVATKLVAGIYKDNNGHPGALLAQGTVNAPVAGAWNKVLLPATTVNAGTTYWVAILSPSGMLKFRDKVGTVAKPSETSGTTLTTLPNTWSTSTISSGGPLSAYGAGY